MAFNANTLLVHSQGEEIQSPIKIAAEQLMETKLEQKYDDFLLCNKNSKKRIKSLLFFLRSFPKSSEYAVYERS